MLIVAQTLCDRFRVRVRHNIVYYHTIYGHLKYDYNYYLRRYNDNNYTRSYLFYNRRY